jgi:hypothetical protein
MAEAVRGDTSGGHGFWRPALVWQRPSGGTSPSSRPGAEWGWRGEQGAQVQVKQRRWLQTCLAGDRERCERRGGRVRPQELS